MPDTVLGLRTQLWDIENVRALMELISWLHPKTMLPLQVILI